MIEVGFMSWGDWYFRPAVPLLILLGLTLLFFAIAEKRLGICWASKSKQECRKATQWILTILLGYVVAWRFPTQIYSAPLVKEAVTAYLEHEFLIGVLALTFGAGIIFVRGNRDSYANAFFRVARVIVAISLLSAPGIAEVSLSEWPNPVFLLLAGIALVVLELFEVAPRPLSLDTKQSEGNTWWQRCQSSMKSCIAKWKKKKEDSHSPQTENHELSFEPVTTADELLPSHKRTAEQLKGLIELNMGSPISICLDGEWGAGKTSVVNATLEMLKKDKSQEYGVIRINAMELEDTKELFHYTFKQIRRVLKERGAYVGLGSEYRRFVSSAAGAVTENLFGEFVSSFFSAESDDYRTEKQRLNSTIERAFPVGKLVLVVDDIERCEREKIKNYVILIKELATMRKCVTIFVADHERLVGAGDNKTAIEENRLFYEKFFNYKLKVSQETDETTWEEFVKLGHLCVLEKICQVSLKEIYTNWIAELNNVVKNMYPDEDYYVKHRAGTDSERQRQEKEKERAKQKAERAAAQVEHLRSQFTNPRTVIKIIRDMELTCKRIEEANDRTELESEAISKYAKQIKLDQVVLLLSYIKTQFPRESGELQAQGQSFFMGLMKKAPDDSPLVLYCTRTFYARFGIWGQADYSHGNAMRFAEQLLIHPDKLEAVFTGNTTIDEERIEDLNEGKTQKWKGNLGKYLETIVRVPKSKQWKKETTELLLKSTKIWIYHGDISIDEVLTTIWDRYKISDEYALAVGLHEELWKLFGETDLLSRASKKVINVVSDYITAWSLHMASKLNQLFRILLPPGAKQGFSGTAELSLQHNEDVFEGLDRYAEGVREVLQENGIDTPCGGYKTILTINIEKAKKKLVKEGLQDYPDIKELLFYAENILSETFYLKKCYYAVKSNDNGYTKPDYSKFCKENLSDEIARLTNGLNAAQGNPSAPVYKEFQQFMEQVILPKRVILTRDDNKRLRQLVSILGRNTGWTYTDYYSWLINYHNPEPEGDIEQEQNNGSG